MVTDFETVKAKKQPNTEKVPIALDPQWAGRVRVAQGNVGAAEIEIRAAESVLEAMPGSAGRDDLADAQEAVDAARAKHDAAKEDLDALLETYDENVVVFTLRALSPDEVDQVREDHPPTPEQKEEARRLKSPAPPWNYETYNPALLHAAMVEPEWSLEQVMEIWHDENWNLAELRRLYGTAEALTTTIEVVDLGED